MKFQAKLTADYADAADKAGKFFICVIRDIRGWSGFLLFAFCFLLCAPASLRAQPGQFVRLNHLGSGVAVPQLFTVTNNAVVSVLSTNESISDGRVLMRTIQNVGTNAVFYLINSTNVSTTNFHGILAGGVATRDGLGSILDLSRVPWPVSLRCETNFTVIVVTEVTQ